MSSQTAIPIALDHIHQVWLAWLEWENRVLYLQCLPNLISNYLTSLNFSQMRGFLVFDLRLGILLTSYLLSYDKCLMKLLGKEFMTVESFGVFVFRLVWTFRYSFAPHLLFFKYLHLKIITKVAYFGVAYSVILQ